MTPRHNSRSDKALASTRNRSDSFTVTQPTQLEFDRALVPEASLNDVRCVRAALVEAIRASGKSRAQIAEEMTYLVGRKVTERMLNGYTAESQDDYLFPAELTRSFCMATGDTRLLGCLADLHGMRVVSAEEYELVNLGRAFLQRSEAEEQIELLKKRLHGRPR